MSTDDEYMSLAAGVGIIPEAQRNRGYDKLSFGPGEGGLPAAPTTKGDTAGAATIDAFLAGVASGADPKALAAELRGSSGRRGAR
jgi:hypothetical protein